jgi:RHS repeat-associated protein
MNNGQGKEKGSQTGSWEMLFAYDEHRLLGEYDTQGVAMQETVWLGNLPVATLRNGTSYFIHSDHLGTPRAITDSSNTEVWRWDSDPFGMAAANGDPDGDGVNFVYNLRFPGQYYDSETSLHYNYYRDYDPSTGRYVESDPIGLGGGLNTFAYVSNSPLMKVDFFGLDDSFTCRCTATGAGIDNTATLKKECSYSCKCSVSSCDGGNQKNVNVNVSRVETSARSGQSWDRGSQICHGQYGYRPRLDDPNWKVQTMFSEFTINQNGEVTYDPGRVEVSNRTYSYFPRTPTATEVSSVIKSELNKQ